MGIHGVDACAPWGSGSSPSSRASSAGVWEASGSSPIDSSKEASQMSSSSSCMRGSRHLCRTWAVPHIILGEAPNCSAQCYRALASVTLCSFLTSHMSLVPWNLHSGMVSLLKTVQARWGIPPTHFVILGCR